jgi:hypothetical protein
LIKKAYLKVTFIQLSAAPVYTRETFKQEIETKKGISSIATQLSGVRFLLDARMCVDASVHFVL